MTTLISDIIRYEAGELDEDEMLVLFQNLIDAGLAWELRGHYGRVAEALVEAGLCSARISKVEDPT